MELGASPNRLIIFTPRSSGKTHTVSHFANPKLHSCRKSEDAGRVSVVATIRGIAVFCVRGLMHEINKLPECARIVKRRLSCVDVWYRENGVDEKKREVRPVKSAPLSQL